jgi:hypothetical protein
VQVSVPQPSSVCPSQLLSIKSSQISVAPGHVLWQADRTVTFTVCPWLAAVRSWSHRAAPS